MSRIRALAAVLCASLAFSTAAAAKDIKISHQFKQGDARDEATRLFVAEVTKRDPGCSGASTFRLSLAAHYPCKWACRNQRSLSSSREISVKRSAVSMSPASSA